MDTDVLVVGAGPTGLMAANQLLRFGVDFLIIDSKDGPTRESRAIGVTPRSLEIYQQLGLSDEVLADAANISSVNVFHGGSRKARVDIGEVGVGLSDFTSLIAYEQSKNETLLARNLKDNRHEVMWKTAFESFVERDDGVEVSVRPADGESFTIRCKYLVACDGAKSPVRHQLGCRFDGGTYEHKFFVADTELTWPMDYDQMVVAPGKKNFCAFFPLKGGRTYRVIGTLPVEYSNVDDVGFSDIEAQVTEVLKVGVSFEKVNWFSVYKLHHRMVQQFRHSRIFLAGDSAHIHSPAGAQGMNTGLQDAYNLIWKLAFVLQGHASDRLLNTYNEERLPFARWLLKFTDRAFTVLTSRNWWIRLVRTQIGLRTIALATKFKLVQKMAFRTVSQIAYSYHRSSLSSSAHKQPLKFRAGDRLPYLPEHDLYHRMSGGGFHLLHINDAPLQVEQQRQLEQNGFPMTVVEMSRDAAWQNQGVTGELFVVVRPDNYIAHIGERFDAELFAQPAPAFADTRRTYAN